MLKHRGRSTIAFVSLWSTAVHAQTAPLVAAPVPPAANATSPALPVPPTALPGSPLIPGGTGTMAPEAAEHA